MSIINQTLRALDARQPGRIVQQVPPRPLASTKPRRANLWVVVVLLPIAGLILWFMSRPVANNLPSSSTRVLHPAALPHAAIPALHPQPALPLAVPPPSPAKVAVAAVSAAAEKRAEAADPGAGATPQAPAGPPGPSSSTTVRSSGPAVSQPPAIHKVVNQSTDREKAEERYRKALTLIRTSQPDQARPLLEEALELSPGHIAARETLAALLSDAGRNQDAETVLRIGRDTRPEHTWFAFSLARLQAARGETEGAVATLQGGMTGRNVDAEYHATLAALLVRLKQYRDAVGQYEQALKLQSGQGTWWMGLGLSLEAQGRNDEARSAFRRALMSGNLPDKLAEFVRAKLTD
jgi:MSHA biogenesis protein MshN